MNKSIKILWFIAIILFIFLLCIDFDNQSFVFFNSTKSFASDFFNVCRYICDRDPYNNELDGFQEKIYPPIAYLLMYPYTLLFDYHNQTFISCSHNLICVLSFISFSLISCAIWIYSSVIVFKKYSNNNILSSLILGCLSCVFLYSIERGNYIILSAALCNLYIAYFDNSSKKYLALICLAVASGLKVYPVILSVLLLRRKDYKTFAMFSVISIIILFLPFLFFVGGFENVPLLIRNVSLQTSVYGSIVSEYKIGVFSIFTLISNLFSVDLHQIADLINIIISTISIAFAFLVKKVKISIIFLLLVIALFPNQAWVYNGMYLIPVVFVFANTNKKSLFLFSLLFLIYQPVQIIIYGHSFSYLMSNFANLVLWGYLLRLAFQDSSQILYIFKKQ